MGGEEVYPKAYSLTLVTLTGMLAQSPTPNLCFRPDTLLSTVVSFTFPHQLTAGHAYRMSQALTLCWLDTESSSSNRNPQALAPYFSTTWIGSPWTIVGDMVVESATCWRGRQIEFPVHWRDFLLPVVLPVEFMVDGRVSALLTQTLWPFPFPFQQTVFTCFSLSDLLHSMTHSIWVHPGLQFSSFYGWVILHLYTCTMSSLSIHLLMDTWVASLSLLL